MSEPFLGEIRMVAFNFAPPGWLECAGQLLSISQYSALFSLLGTTYGGDGVTIFGLPDLRGRVPVGHSESGAYGTSPNRMGQTGGQETVTLAASQMPDHTHGASAITTLKGNDSAANASSPEGSVPGNTGRSNLYQTESPNVDRAEGAATTSVTISNAGGGQPHDNMPPYQVVRFVIATQGIYPSRT